MTETPGAAASLLMNDVILREVALETRRAAPYAKSIMLFGSRARQSPARSLAGADYDIVVSVPVCRLPAATRSLAAVSARLSASTGAKVTVNPAPAWRLRHPRGNFMALKLKREGIALDGEPVETAIGQVSEEDIGQSWLFFYLASQAKRLLDAAAPVIMGAVSQSGREQALRYASAKAMAAAAEIQALDRYGVYLSQPSSLAELMSARGEPELTGLAETAAAWLSDGEGSPSGQRCWQVAREALLGAGEHLSRRHFDTGFVEDEKFRSAYLRSAGKARFMRNLQFVALSITRGEAHLRALLSYRGAAEMVKLALFGLLAATESEAEIDEEVLSVAERAASPLTGRPARGAPLDRWVRLHEGISRVYPSACVALGV